MADRCWLQRVEINNEDLGLFKTLRPTVVTSGGSKSSNVSLGFFRLLCLGLLQVNAK